MSPVVPINRPKPETHVFIAPYNRPVKHIGFRSRLLLILALFALVPSIVLTVAWGGTMAQLLPLIGSSAAWDTEASEALRMRLVLPYSKAGCRGILPGPIHSVAAKNARRRDLPPTSLNSHTADFYVAR